MNAHGPASFPIGLRHFSGATVFFRRVLTGFVILCLLLNGLAFRLTLEPGDQDVLSRVLASQSVLLDVFCLSTLPIKIINGLMTEQTGPAARQTKDTGNHAKESANGSSDCSLMNLAQKAGEHRSGALKRTASGGNVPAALMACSLCLLLLTRARSSLTGPLREESACNSYFFLLPRSSIGDHYAMMVSQTHS